MVNDTQEYYGTEKPRIIYLIDYENVHETGFAAVTGGSDVYVFYTPNVPKTSLDVFDGIDVNFHFVKAAAGKQSLDMHLVSYLGYLIAMKKGEPGQEYVIVSNDTDFDNVINFWRIRGISCRRRNIVRQESVSEAQTKVEPEVKSKPETVFYEVPERQPEKRNSRSRGSRGRRRSGSGEQTVAVQDTAVKDTAIQEATLKDIAIQETAVKDTAMQEAAVKETAVQETEVQETAVKDTAMQEAAVKETAVQAAAVQAAAVQKATVQKTAIQKTVGQEAEVRMKAPAADAGAADRRKSTEPETVKEQTTEEKTTATEEKPAAAIEQILPEEQSAAASARSSSRSGRGRGRRKSQPKQDGTEQKAPETEPEVKETEKQPREKNSQPKQENTKGREKTQLNNKIVQLLNAGGFDNGTVVMPIAQIVSSNFGKQNARQKTYIDIIKKYGQKEGLKYYGAIKAEL